MAVKDSPDTRIKAAVAKAAMARHEGLAFLHNLVDGYGLQAVSVINLLPEGERTIRTFAWDRRASEILGDWINNMVVAKPPPAVIGAVVVGVRDDGVIDFATFGDTKESCPIVAAWIAPIMCCLTVAPFQTYFGWSNGGVPLAMTEAELAGLSDGQRRWVEHNTHPSLLAGA